MNDYMRLKTKCVFQIAIRIQQGVLFVGGVAALADRRRGGKGGSRGRLERGEAILGLLTGWSAKAAHCA